MRRLSLLTLLAVFALTIAIWPPGLATAATPADNPTAIVATEMITEAAMPPPGTILQNERILEYLRTAGTATYLIWRPLAEKPDVRTVTDHYYRDSAAMVMANNFGKRDRYRQQRE